MLVRQVVIPISTDELWEALTEPDRVAAWFGSQVEWDLHPGGPARFLDDTGAVRHGVVDDIVPGRRLRFRWWPEDESKPTSRVGYDLEPADDGTRLTVTEELVPAPPAAPPAASLDADAGAGAAWTVWDDRLFGCWAHATRCVGAR